MHDNTNSLNDDEKHRLRQIEADLQREDPEFAAAFTGSQRHHLIARLVRRVRHRAGRVAGLTVGALVGVITLSIGLVLPAPVVGILGFSILVVALNRLVDVGPAILMNRLRSLLGLQQDDSCPQDEPPVA